MRLEHDWFPGELPANVFLGPRSWLYSAYAFLHYRSRAEAGVVIGSDSGVYNGTFFDLGEHGRVIIGNYCTLVGPKISTNGLVIIGDYSLIAHDVVIAETGFARPPAKEDPTPRPDPASVILIGENVWIGAAAILLTGARIGANAIVGAAALVDFDVPPNAVVAGNPGRIVGQASIRL